MLRSDPFPRSEIRDPRSIRVLCAIRGAISLTTDFPIFSSYVHPALRHAITVDLVTGKARHTDYSSNLNPPILHHKEAFLPPDHPSLSAFSVPSVL